MKLLRLFLSAGLAAAVAAGPARAGEPPKENGIKLPTTDEEKQKLSGREVKILQRQMKEREDTAGAAFKNAETAFLVGEYDKAIEEFLSVSREFQDTSYRMRAVMRVGDVYYRQKKYDRAVSYYQRSLKVPSELWWPDDTPEHYARADYMIGVCYFDEKAMNRAFAHFRRFVQKHPTSKLVDRAFDFIGRGNMSMERYGQAIEAFKMVGTASISKEARRTISPGEELYVRVLDPDVGMATRHGVVPVVVKTTSGDEERMDLRSLGLGSPAFLGTIKTRLGAPRLTKSLDEAFSPEIQKNIDGWLAAAEGMLEEAAEKERELAALKAPNAETVEVPPDANPEEVLVKAVTEYEQKKAALQGRIQKLKEDADRFKHQAHGTFDRVFATIENILEEWKVDEETEAVKPDKKAAAEEEDASQTSDEEKTVSLSDVFTQQQINDTRKAVTDKPTDETSYRFRRALLNYWHEQLLLEYKTLDLNGSDTITVDYVDLHGTEVDGQKRVDELGVASDGMIMCVGPDYLNIVPAVILGDMVRVRVVDPDMDLTDEVDAVDIIVASMPKAVEEEKRLEDEEEEAESETEDADASVDVFAPQDEEEMAMPVLVPPNVPFINVTLKETGPHTGVFIGEIPTIPPSADHPAAQLKLDKDRVVRVSYADKRTSSHGGEWAVAAEVGIVPGSEGRGETIDLQDSVMDRRSTLEKGVALGKLARVYQELGLKLDAKLAFDTALAVVKKVVDAERGSPLGEEATYQMWDLYFASGDEEAAAEACQRLIAAFPNSPLADDALLIMGKAAANRKENHAALNHFGRLVNSYPDSDLAAEAQYLIAELKSKGVFDVAAYELCANKYPDSNFAARSLLSLSEYYIENKDFDRARDYLERITLDFPDFDRLDKVTYMRGICAYRTGDIELSYTLMHETIQKYPGTAVAKSASKVVALLGNRLKQN